MKKQIGFGVFTFVLILISCFCMKSVVMGKDNARMQMQEQYYLELEEQYIETIREQLYEEGYGDCGIMLTRTIFEDGSREYRVTVHHRLIEKLGETEKSALEYALIKEAFTSKDVKFVIAFI